MKYHIKLGSIPFLLLGLTSCNTAEQMICLINQSTATIHENREAVEGSTAAIRKNKELVEKSNRAIEENYHILKAVKES